ncbi:ATPase, T2SS/T4P/T4SS family [Lysinibacillus sphaericus]|uniref:ATPase, T2SS/T4P/T4SS family n=1 Tax=Lysinibacillus sphaericus TaxID=1421 RepID=UPI0018CE061F|nr:ATPase, T2SS/T4P/T4SS family [Lysinibacillus sphaericus]
MHEITLNPIAIKDGLKTIGFINFLQKEKVIEGLSRLIVREFDFKKNKGGKILINQIVTTSDMYSIDLERKNVEVRVEDLKTGRDTYVETFNLCQLAGVDKVKSSALKMRADEEEIYKKLFALVSHRMDNPQGTAKEIELHTEMMANVTKSDKARRYVEAKIREIVSKEDYLNTSEVLHFTKRLYAYMYGMGVLQELDDDPEVGEIIVNAVVYPEFSSTIDYIKNHVKYEYHLNFASYDEMYAVFERSIAFEDKELNKVDNSQVEAIRANRDRVTISIPYASENYVLNIRKFSNFIPDLENMRKSGTVDLELEQILKVLVKGKANIAVFGEMDTGKTSFINFLLTLTEKMELKTIIAAVAETDVERVLKGHRLVVLNVNENLGYTFEKQMKTALRTTASRIVIPEVRGSEIRQVYEANLKTRGNIFSGHALDANEALNMMTDMYLDGSVGQYEYVKSKLAKSIDVVLIMKVVGNSIRVKSLSEVVIGENGQYESINDLYEFIQDSNDITTGYYRATGNKMSKRLKKRLNDFVPMDEIEAA